MVAIQLLDLLHVGLQFFKEIIIALRSLYIWTLTEPLFGVEWFCALLG